MENQNNSSNEVGIFQLTDEMKRALQEREQARRAAALYIRDLDAHQIVSLIWEANGLASYGGVIDDNLDCTIQTFLKESGIIEAELVINRVLSQRDDEATGL